MANNSLMFSTALVGLLKGVVTEKLQPKIWTTIIENQLQIEDYVSKIGLTLIIQEQDGYAYLKQRMYENEEVEIPRLVSKRQLGFNTSLVLVMLRKELVELNKSNQGERFIVSEEEIMEKIRPYLKDTTDEAKQRKDIGGVIKKIEDMGFLRCLKNSTTQFEILPLIRGFVDAQWLEDFDRKLDEYMAYNSNATNQGDQDEDELI